MEQMSQRLELLHISQFENDAADEREALDTLIKKVDKLANMALQEHRTEKNRAKFIRKALRGKPWVLTMRRPPAQEKFDYYFFIDELFRAQSEYVLHNEAAVRLKEDGDSTAYRKSRWKDSTAKVHFAGQGRFGKRPAGLRRHRKDLTGSTRRRTIICVNCERQGCSLFNCEQPLDAERIKRNVERLKRERASYSRAMPSKINLGEAQELLDDFEEELTEALLASMTSEDQQDNRSGEAPTKAGTDTDDQHDSEASETEDARNRVQELAFNLVSHKKPSLLDACNSSQDSDEDVWNQVPLNRPKEPPDQTPVTNTAVPNCAKSRTACTGRSDTRYREPISGHHIGKKKIRRKITAPRIIRGVRYPAISGGPRYSGRIVKEVLKVKVNSEKRTTFCVYDDQDFQGACGDTGAQKSVVGLKQAKAYCKKAGRKLKLKPSPYAYKFWDGIRNSLGTIVIRMLTPDGGYLPLTVDVVDADIPLLLGLDILTKEQLLIDYIDDILISKTYGWQMPITRSNGHLFIKWPVSKVLFTRSELHRLHLHFFHPSARKLFNLLKRARPADTDSNTLKVLEDIASACSSCRQFSVKPFRFRVSLPPDKIVFNQEVALDIMWLEGNPVLHIVDTHTHYQNAVLLRGNSVENVWDAFVEAWSSVYVGYPNKLRIDQASVFTSKRWEQLSSMHGVEIQLSGVESHNSIGSGERYHDPLRRVFRVLRSRFKETDPEILLRYAVKGMNDTMGPEGLVPTLLVYGVLPTFPVTNSDLPRQKERMEALALARKEMATVTAELRVAQALRSKLPPATKYLFEPGDRVQVYREDSKRYEGPYSVSRVAGKQVFVECDGKEKQFSKTQVIPHPEDRGDKELRRLLDGMRQFTSNPPPGVFVTEVLHPADPRGSSGIFDDAIAKGLEGLARNKVYEVVTYEDVPAGANVLGGRFVLSIKNVNTGAEMFKARFVVQGHTDAEKNILVHNSTNLKQSSVRVLIAIAAVFGFRLWSQDVTLAYLQSAQKLMREVYVKPTGHFRLQPDQLLKLLKPLYGLADSGDYWHITFSNHLKQDLMMTPTAGDLSLFFKVIHGQLEGITGAYVDDSIGTGTEKFEKESRKTEKRFKSKAREFDNFTFAGIEIEKTEDGFLMHQKTYAKRIEPLSKDCTYSQFRSRRHELAWLVHTRPDIAAPVNLLAQVTEQMFNRIHIKQTNDVIRRVRDAPKRGIKQQKLDVDTLSLRVFDDASFANNADMKYQLGFIILLCDASGKCNVLHFASYKAKRVTRSVLGAEVYAFADAFDFAYLLRHDLRLMLGRKLPLMMFTDSESLFKVIVKSTTTTEKRLMIDIRAARDAYDAQEIDNVGWLSTDNNPADGLTKGKRCVVLEQLLDSGRLDVEIGQWVIRTPFREEDDRDSRVRDTPSVKTTV